MRLAQRADSFMRPETISDSAHRWGWKEPNTHIVLDRLIQHMPNMKYIHVVRNGLDMAYSSNQNQLVNWGEFILGKPIEMTPSSSLQYWCAMHRRVLEIGTQMGDSQFMWLNYDALCSHPQQELPKLLQFLEVGDRSTNAVKLLLKHIKPPASQGRFKAQGIRHFSTDDIAFVKQLGFDIGP